LEDITGKLMSVLGRYKTPATWAVADPAVSAATERITTAGCHEIAVLGDHSWVGRQAGRSRFWRELSRRVMRGRAASLPITSLVLRDVQLDEHLDLLVKQGLSVVQSPMDHTIKAGLFSRQASPQPHTLRFGLWNFPASQRLPGQARWSIGGGGTRAAKRGIERVIAAHGVYQLVIDSLEMAAQGASALRVLDKILRHAERRTRQGVLDVSTLSSVARQLAGNYHAVPARSILRPAA
jgi:hypothetical protein